MKTIGITGLIGSGKSVVMTLLNRLYGLPIFDCDTVAKEVYYDPEVREKLKSAMNFDPIHTDGMLKKDQLRDVLNDPLRKKILEDMIHQGVGRAFQNWKKEQTSEMVLLESAILFTSGFHEYCDYIIAVSSEETTRKERVMARDNNMSDKRFETLVKLQSEEEKRQASDADFHIDNNGRISLIQQVEEIYGRIYGGGERERKKNLQIVI